MSFHQPSYAHSLRIAYNPENNNYLAVWKCSTHNEGGYGTIVTQRLDSKGTPDTRQYDLVEFMAPVIPDVIYNSVAKKFLVISTNIQTAEGNIYGQFLSPMGIPYPNNFPITNWPHFEYFPRIAVNTLTGEFLVSWSDQYQHETTVYVQRLKANGILQGGPIPVANDGENFIWENDITYNPTNNQYFIVWGFKYSGVIKGRILGSNAIPVGTELDVSANALDIDQENFIGSNLTRVVFNSHLNEYFIVWGAHDDHRIDVKMSRLSAQGTLLYTHKDLVHSDFSYNSWPDVSYNTLEDDYFVTWERSYSTYLGRGMDTPNYRYVTGWRYNFTLKNSEH